MFLLTYPEDIILNGNILKGMSENFANAISDKENFTTYFTHILSWTVLLIDSKDNLLKSTFRNPPLYFGLILQLVIVENYI